jgi:WD40 repeat protein
MRRQRVIVGVSVTVAVVSLTLAAFAFIERSAAVSNQRTAQSRQLAASAEAALASDPQLSTLLALQALRVKYTTQAEGALRDALPQLQVLTQVKPRVPMLYSAFSPDGSEFVDVVPGGDVEIRSGNGRLLRTLGAPDDTNTRTSATFSPDGARVVTSDLSGGVTSWNLSTGKSTALFSVTDRSGPIAASSVAFDRTVRRLVTADVGGSARIWDLAGNQIAAFAASSHAALVNAQFSPEGSRVVTASHGGVARIWDVPSGRQVGAMVEPSRAALTGATFNGDGSLVVTASEDGTARIWKAATGRLVGVLPEPSGAAITSAGFSPDGLRVVTASADGTTRLWDARTDRQLTVLVAPFRGRSTPLRSPLTVDAF